MQFRTLIAAAVISAVATTASAALKDGSYEAKVVGHNAPMTVKVTIAKGKITGITTQDLESFGVGKTALKEKGAEIVARQSLGIDAMSGATLSTFALIQGVEQCLKSAGATQADLDKWTKKAVAYPTKPLTVTGDVAIIGGGGTGLAAAVSALENGAGKVVIIEKLGYLGGSTNVSGGALNAVDDKRQKAQGIKDSVETFYESTMKGGHNVGTPELVRYLTQNAYPTVEWMEKQGVVFRDRIGAATGSLGQRSHYGVKPAGYAYTSVFENVLKTKYKDRVEFLMECPAEAILTDKSGKVTGVKAVRHGQPITVKADSVVLATGGFGANVKFRQEVNTGVWKEVVLDNRIGTTNIQKAAQGDGLRMAQKVGADLIGLDDIQIHPCGTPGTGLMENIRTSGRNRVFVNIDGDRFVNEGAARDVLAKAIFAQPKGTYWVVVNHLRYPSRDWVDANGATIANMVALGSVIEAKTLDELAQKTGMKAADLKKSIDDYNAVVSGKAKDKFGFEANNKADKLMTEGPWYACKKVPTVHHTMGGIKINTKAEVLNTSGKVIPGLYASGEVTGGIHGSNRLGGNAIADVMVYGRTAGTNAANFAAQK